MNDDAVHTTAMLVTKAEVGGRRAFDELVQILPLVNLEESAAIRRSLQEDGKLCARLLDLVCGRVLCRNPVPNVALAETSPGKRMKISESLVRARLVSEDFFMHVFHGKDGDPPADSAHAYRPLCDIVHQFIRDVERASPHANAALYLRLAPECALPTMDEVHGHHSSLASCGCMDCHDGCSTSDGDSCECEDLHILRNENRCGGLLDHIKELVHREEEEEGQGSRCSPLLAGLAAQILVLQGGMPGRHDESLHSYVSDNVHDSNFEGGVVSFSMFACRCVYLMPLSNMQMAHSAKVQWMKPTIFFCAGNCRSRVQRRWHGFP